MCAGRERKMYYRDDNCLIVFAHVSAITYDGGGRVSVYVDSNDEPFELGDDRFEREFVAWLGR